MYHYRWCATFILSMKQQNNTILSFFYSNHYRWCATFENNKMELPIETSLTIMFMSFCSYLNSFQNWLTIFNSIN